MAMTERKYKGSLSLGKLEIALEAHEQLFGVLCKLEALGGFTIATYDDSEFPAAESLALLPMIGDADPPPPAGAEHLLNGETVVVGVPTRTAAYRTS
jgi:hypothetical protein